MSYCSRCGNQIMDDAVICVHCGCAVKRIILPVDRISIGLCILSFFIPLVGIIYWPLKHAETPKKATACGLSAIASWVLSIAFFVFMMIISRG